MAPTALDAYFGFTRQAASCAGDSEDLALRLGPRGASAAMSAAACCKRLRQIRIRRRSPIGDNWGEALTSCRTAAPSRHGRRRAGRATYTGAYSPLKAQQGRATPRSRPRLAAVIARLGARLEVLGARERSRPLPLRRYRMDRLKEPKLGWPPRPPARGRGRHDPSLRFVRGSSTAQAIGAPASASMR
jgi:hypothetical protein